MAVNEIIVGVRAAGFHHFIPILEAVRDRGVFLTIISQGSPPFAPPPVVRPWIAVIGDDADKALGPTAFDGPSVSRLLAASSAIAIISAAGDPKIYGALAAGVAAFRFPVTIIETRQEFEGSWLETVRAAAPKKPLLCHFVAGGAVC